MYLYCIIKNVKGQNTLHKMIQAKPIPRFFRQEQGLKQLKLYYEREIHIMKVKFLGNEYLNDILTEGTVYEVLGRTKTQFKIKANDGTAYKFHESNFEIVDNSPIKRKKNKFTGATKLRNLLEYDSLEYLDENKYGIRYLAGMDKEKVIHFKKSMLEGAYVVYTYYTWNEEIMEGFKNEEKDLSLDYIHALEERKKGGFTLEEIKEDGVCWSTL